MEQLSLKHINFHHKSSHGFITLAQKSPEWTQKFCRIDDIEKELYIEETTDCYFSLNSFRRRSRRIGQLLELRSLYVDIDCYRLNLKPEWVLGKLEFEVFREVIPEPNYVIFSGQGLSLVWLIESVSVESLAIWREVEDYLFAQCLPFGADAAAKDPSRVFRIAGSKNSKNDKVVRVEYRHQYRYDLDDIRSEYVEHTYTRTIPSKTLNKQPISEARNRNWDRSNTPCNKVSKSENHNLYTLNSSRIQDLIKIVQLREHNPIHYREKICFLYRYWHCCTTGDFTQALQDTLELNASFKIPLPDNEVIRDTRNAEELAAEWRTAVKIGASVNPDDGGALGIEDKSKSRIKGYRFTNEFLISWLEISLEEEEQLQTIISKREKYRRRNQSRSTSRRHQGIATREEYLRTMSVNTSKRIEQLRAQLLINPNISNYVLAQLMGVSESYVRKLKGKITAHQ